LYIVSYGIYYVVVTFVMTLLMKKFTSVVIHDNMKIG
jgi:hypothetical protein